MTTARDKRQPHGNFLVLQAVSASLEAGSEPPTRTHSLMTNSYIRKKLAKVSRRMRRMANRVLGPLPVALPVAKPVAVAPEAPAALPDVNFALIVGAQRSGTTWLQKLCAAHPDIAGGEESHLFARYLGNLLHTYYTDLAPQDLTALPKGLACFLTADEIREAYRVFALTVFRKMLWAKPGARFVVEKTPDHVLHLRYIRHVFPNVKVIHIIRDARDVVVSQMAAAKQSWGESWAAKTAEEGAQRWTEWVQLGREAADTPGLYYEVRYEQLLNNGVETLSGVFAFLGAPMPLERVKGIYDQFSLAALKAKTAPDPFIRCGEPKKLIHPTACADFFRTGQSGGWSGALSAQEKALVEEIAGPLLKELGYLS
ncbi:MAG: sulfotransferase [Tepidisphaeraceae bacterium]